MKKYTWENEPEKCLSWQIVKELQDMIHKVREKQRKLWQYIRLKSMFLKKSEFRRIHPELVGLWGKKFAQMIKYSSNRTFPIAEEFLNVRIEKVKDSKYQNTDAHVPILICALKNDIQKMVHFMEHYRRLGIKKFVFLDNMSTDGTFEYLLEQEDADVYRCAHPFTADRKIAWVNRLIAEIGMNRWYLMADSDEFFTYYGCREHTINEFVDRVEEKNLKRVGVVHLDMYPKDNLFSKDNTKDFVQRYCYFDKDTYEFSKAANGMRIVGGPRKRIFGTTMKVSGYRLVFFEVDDIVPSAHFMIPFEKSLSVPVYLVSLHYKFVNESDYSKMIEAVETGMHANNSEEYKTYYRILKENPDISLYDEKHSAEFTEENLRSLDFVEDIFQN